jgi:hypothetical protein
VAPALAPSISGPWLRQWRQVGPVRAGGPSRYLEAGVAAEVRFKNSEHAKHASCSVALERRASGFHQPDILQVADAGRQVVLRITSARQTCARDRAGAQFLTGFRGNAAALLGADHVAAGGSQGGLLNGKVLVRPC